MILYNGASGGLGSQFRAALERSALGGHALKARLEDRAGLRAELAALSPGAEAVLVQMAARVSVPGCEQDPAGAQKTNVDDTRATVEDFLDWAEQKKARPRVLYVSSGHVYAAQPAGVRIDERSATAPRSVYARTKLKAEQELAALAERRGVPLTVARVFGLIAPRQPPFYVLPGLIRRVREGKLAGVPGLKYVRDYLDSRDVCDDLVLLLHATNAGLVNVCSGEGVTLESIVLEIIRVLRPTEEARLRAELTEAPGRPDDVPSIVGNPARFIALTGTAPRRIPLAQTVRDACAAD